MCDRLNVVIPKVTNLSLAVQMVFNVVNGHDFAGEFSCIITRLPSCDVHMRTLIRKISILSFEKVTSLHPSAIDVVSPISLT